jgi:hypothetical protein
MTFPSIQALKVELPVSVSVWLQRRDDAIAHCIERAIIATMPAAGWRWTWRATFPSSSGFG